jgi:hypothetical protein
MFLSTYAHLYPGDLHAAAGALESARLGCDAGIPRGRSLRSVDRKDEDAV